MQTKVYIPFEHYEGKIGGPQTFMANLKTYLQDHKVDFIDDPYKATTVLFPISLDKKVLENLKARGAKVVQRLDGVLYPSKHSEKELEFNEIVKDIYVNFADYVVFQSDYSRRQCFEVFGKKNASQYSLVINGVNRRIFYPSKEHKSDFSKVIKFVTTSHFRNIDMIEPIVKALDEIKLDYKFELHVVGPIINDKIKAFLDRNYIIHHGPKSLEGVSEILKQSDIYLYSHLNPPCPNSVIEAISTGLPVVSFASGAMEELCFFSKELLAYVSDDLFQLYKDFDHKKLVEKIQLCVKNFEKYKKLALENAQIYDFEECGKKYLEILQKKQNEYADQYYNNRYQNENYRTKVSGFEVSRVRALEDVIKRVLNLKSGDILDYGSGNGLYVSLWEELFDKKNLNFCDISEIANKQLIKKYPAYKNKVKLIKGNKTDFKDNSFDVVISVEVMEHVDDLKAYVTEVKRLLKPGGYFIWTTPCANKFSIEYIYNKLTGQIQKTAEGFVRWEKEDPSHVRRLKTNQIKDIMLEDIGFQNVNFKMRAHFFSFICSKLLERKLISDKLAVKLMDLDYTLFRNFPNGASMIGYAKK